MPEVFLTPEGIIKYKIKKLKGRLRALFGGTNQPAIELNRTQEMFCTWNAERLGISVSESRDRYTRSLSVLHFGHRGKDYRYFADIAHEVFIPFYDDNEREIFDTYAFHGPLHMLRFLAFPDPVWADDHPIITGLADKQELTILDFGCGLAKGSCALARRFKAAGKDVHLVLSDIPTVRKPFLLWMMEQDGVKTTFLDCTPERPIPEFLPHDLCIAVDVLEHLHNPHAYLVAIDSALKAGGHLLTDIEDHTDEFMHPTPNLTPLRDELERLNYKVITKDKLFVKSSG